MKIALITHHWVPNFGANLQALASFNYLKQKHDVTVINYVYAPLLKRYKDIVCEKQLEEHANFCRTYLRMSPLLNNEDQIVEYCANEQFDIIISGSDAIFRLSKEMNTHEGPFPNPFWLTWAKKRKGYMPRTGFISGSMMGASYYSFPRSLKEKIRNELKSVDFISVRDIWTKWMFQLITCNEINPVVSPDPVSVLNNNLKPTINDLEHIKNIQEINGKYILYSARPERVSLQWLEELKRILNSKGYELYGLPMPEMEMEGTFDKNISLPLSPILWYNWIKYSAGFIGERFHPIACALFNRVPFMCMDNYRKRGIKGHLSFIQIPITSKIYDLCVQSRTKNNIRDVCDFKKIKPGRVVKNLFEMDMEAVNKYILNAANLFESTMVKLLGYK